MAVFDGGVAGFQCGGRDCEAADAGAGHAAGAGITGDVAPGHAKTCAEAGACNWWEIVDPKDPDINWEFDGQ